MNVLSALKLRSFEPNSGSSDSSSSDFGQSFWDLNTTPLLNSGGQTGQDRAAGSGQTASVQTVSQAGSGFVINNTWGTGVTTALQNDVVAAEQYLEKLFPNAVSVNVTFQVDSLGPDASADNSFSSTHVTYSQFVTALQLHARTATGRAAAAALSQLSDPTGGTGLDVSIGEARILGLADAGSGTDDTLTLNSVYWTASDFQNDPTDTMAVVEHELSEGIMGRVGELGQFGNGWAPMDFFRFTSGGQRDYAGGGDGLPSYFGVNGSSVYTGLQFHGSYANAMFDGQDPADWDNVGDDSNDADPFGPGGPGLGAPGTLSATDIKVMQALGWGTAPPESDFTGDSTSDVLWYNSTNGVVGDWVMNQGIPSWHVVGQGSATVNVEGFGNFTGNATSDILWENPSNGLVGDWLMSNNQPTWQQIGQGSTTMNIAGVGDFNGDGTDDILWQNPANNYVGIWQMQNNAPTWEAVGYGSTTMNIAGVGDFTGNGKDDILWENPTNNLVGMWAMNGSTATWSLLGQGSTTMNIVGVGDFTGNGTDDILWENPTNGTIGFWGMSNGQATSWNVVATASTAYQLADIADYYGNGTDDILWRNPTTGDVGVWAMNNGQATWHDLGISSTAFNTVKA